MKTRAGNHITNAHLACTMVMTQLHGNQSIHPCSYTMYTACTHLKLKMIAGSWSLSDSLPGTAWHPLCKRIEWSVANTIIQITIVKKSCPKLNLTSASLPWLPGHYITGVHLPV